MSDLFRIETDRCLLVWGSGRKVNPHPLSGVNPPAGRFAFRPRRAGVRLGPQSWYPGASNGTGEGSVGTGLRLFEETEYPFFLRSLTGASAAVEHRDPVLLRGLESSDGGRVVHGRINFGAQVGRSVFAVRVGEETEFDFEVEVFPTKLDYADDYASLVADTQDVLTGLALEYLRSTFRLGRESRAEPRTDLEWLTLLRHAGDDLEHALNHIAQHPERALARGSQPARAERIVRPDAALRRTVLRGGGAGRAMALPGGLAVREYLPDRRARPTLDTPEHRWLAAQLGRIRQRLARVRSGVADHPPSERRQRTLEELDTLEMRVVRLAGTEPLAAAVGEPPSGFASPQLLTAPGYREAYRACLLLSLALRLEGGPVRLAVKELHLLYEQWCFLTLVRLVAETIGRPLPAQDLVAAEQLALRVLLRKGSAHAVRFAAVAGRRISLVYNPRFGGDPLLVPQQPDMLIEVRDPQRGVVRLVLDAKYRLDASPAYLHRYGSPGPPEDALNSLHRYRDAILDPSAAGAGETVRRTVSQAAALFPFREAEPGVFRTSRLWKSIERIGVGAIPLLPGATGYLEEWMRGVIGWGE